MILSEKIKNPTVFLEIVGFLRLSKNCRLIQKEDELQGEKGLEKGASPLFHLK